MPKNLDLQIAANTDSISNFETGSVFFVGTATVIIRFAGFTILTDPNFLHAGDHVHLGYGMTSERLTEPAIDIDELPPIDFCVLSHYHGDHFDQIVEEKLQKDLPIITTEHASGELESKGFKAAVALDTWDSVTIEKGQARVQITSLPGQHGPGMVDFALLYSTLRLFLHSSSSRLRNFQITDDFLRIFNIVFHLPDHRRLQPPLAFRLTIQAI